MVHVKPSYYNIRIKFSKVGDLQYISHLDLVRTMQKALKRAKIPLWHTEGFNPKPKMVFGPPLSIGVESECEFLDVRTLNTPDFEDIKEKLNQNLPKSLAVAEVYEPKKSLLEIEWLSYTITVKTQASSDELQKKLSDFFGMKQINVLKKTKKGDQTVDIRPLIKSVSLDGVEGGVKIDCLLSSSSQSFLNPEHIIKAIKAGTDVFSGDLINESYTVLRHRAYCADMTEFR